jgi:hypothetical protein
LNHRDTEVPEEGKREKRDIGKRREASLPYPSTHVSITPLSLLWDLCVSVV